MIEEPRRAMIRIELTERQKEQIRKATGRKVNSLELRLQGLPDPAEPPAGEAEKTKGRKNREPLEEQAD